ncbi:MAG: hypothetical protein V3R99_09880 [Thermoguttaceae bacterium]
MVDQPRLSDAEWELVGELLERERGELPAEIRHTRTTTVREELRDRARMVKDLLQRLKVPVPT